MPTKQFWDMIRNLPAKEGIFVGPAYLLERPEGTKPMKETTYKCDLCHRQLNPQTFSGKRPEGWGLVWTEWTDLDNAGPQSGARLDPRGWETSPIHLCQICVRAVHELYHSAAFARDIQPESIPEIAEETP